jgi:hypothetical protein
MVHSFGSYTSGWIICAGAELHASQGRLRPPWPFVSLSDVKNVRINNY